MQPEREIQWEYIISNNSRQTVKPSAKADTVFIHMTLNI